MLNKKSIKIIGIVLLIALLLVTVFGTSVMAVDGLPDVGTKTPDGNVAESVGTILGYIRWAGLAIAIAMAMFVGIKYVTASPDGKAEIKKTLTIYVLGIILIVSASAIVGFIGDNLKIA